MPTITISEKPWSAYTEADYSIEQWHNACLIHQHTGPPTSKAQCKLPVKTPSGTLNRNGVIAAAGALAGARTPLQASPEEKSKAAKALINYYNQMSMKPTPRMLALAHSDMSDYLAHHGIKGMRWGHRSAGGKEVGRRKTATASRRGAHLSTKQKTAVKNYGKDLTSRVVLGEAQRGGTKVAEILVNRGAKHIPLPDKELSPGKAFARDLLIDSGKAAVGTLARGVAVAGASMVLNMLLKS